MFTYLQILVTPLYCTTTILLTSLEINPRDNLKMWYFYHKLRVIFGIFLQALLTKYYYLQYCLNLNLSPYPDV